MGAAPQAIFAGSLARDAQALKFAHPAAAGRRGSDRRRPAAICASPAWRIRQLDRDAQCVACHKRPAIAVPVLRHSRCRQSSGCRNQLQAHRRRQARRRCLLIARTTASYMLSWTRSLLWYLRQAPQSIACRRASILISVSRAFPTSSPTPLPHADLDPPRHAP